MLTINSESDIINNVDSEGNESCIVQGYESNYQNQWIAHLIPGQDVDQNGPKLSIFGSTNKSYSIKGPQSCQGVQGPKLGLIGPTPGSEHVDQKYVSYEGI